MPRLRLAAALAAILSVSALVTSPMAAPEPDATIAPRMGTWGFDMAGRDTSVSPGTDFNRYANGTYLDNMVMPEDRARYGAFDALNALSEVRVRHIIETSATDANASGDEQRVGALYRSFMDEARVNALDAAPLAPDLARIRAATTRQALAALMGESPRGYWNTFFPMYIAADAKAPTRYVVYLGQGGLGLPDRDYYLEASFAEKKTLYQAYVARQLTAIGWENANQAAAAIVALETKIAQASWDRAESRDADKTYNAVNRAQLRAALPGFPVDRYLAAAGLGSVRRVVLGENTAMTRIAKIFAETPVSTLQAWQAFNLVDQAAPYLSRRFYDNYFDFRGRALSGQPAQRPRWKRGVNLVNGQIGEAVGKLYVAAYFPPSSKAKMEALVEDLRRALSARINRLTWMSPQTKARAQAKLAALRVKIGYPVKWRDYSSYRIDEHDLYGNVARGITFDWDYRVARLNQPVDRDEWEMTPQTVNAYYMPTANEVVFPAAILQPPFFDPDADPAVNYGAIGAVIGHEITHGFDDQGRKFDLTGALTDWWLPADAADFESRTARLGAQYAAFEPFPGMHVDGDNTMGENVADLGGLLMAYDAYHLSLGGQTAPVVDGLTGDQRFFLGFAQVWRTKSRDDFIKRQLVSDPHSPEEFRILGTIRNVDAWYDAFGVRPGDRLYVKPEDRVRIW